jgi:hypothetical protein
MADPSARNGSFEISGAKITFVPKGAFSDSARFDPASDRSWDSAYIRVSDGQNASPFCQVRVVSLNLDTYSEGIPDSWRTHYFGSPNPGAGANRHANQDFDGDGFSNVWEYVMGSDPADPKSNLILATSGLASLEWTAKPYEVYEIQSSSDFRVWMRASNPVAPTDVTAIVPMPLTGDTKQFFRVEKVP